jgi:hypothetical protein
MGAWLPILLVAVAQIALRLIAVVGVVWQERARSESHLAQLEAAASSGATLCEQLGNGAALVIIPGRHTIAGAPEEAGL